MVNTIQRKLEVFLGVGENLLDAIVIDGHPEDIQNAIEKSIFGIRQYPEFELIKLYPLGRILADHRAVSIERNLCLLLTDHAPEVTLDIIIRQVDDAVSNLLSYLQ